MPASTENYGEAETWSIVEKSLYGPCSDVMLWRDRLCGFDSSTRVGLQAGLSIREPSRGENVLQEHFHAFYDF